MLSVRAATVNDVGPLGNLILELAEYEHERDLVAMTEADLARDGLGAQPKFCALIAEWHAQGAGCALFFGFSSTGEGHPELFLEDLYVRPQFPQFPKRGIGKALLASVGIAEREKCYGVRWKVLSWNPPAIELFNSLGAGFLEPGWRVMLSEEVLDRLAEGTA